MRDNQRCGSVRARAATDWGTRTGDVRRREPPNGTCRHRIVRGAPGQLSKSHIARTLSQPLIGTMTIDPQSPVFQAAAVFLLLGLAFYIGALTGDKSVGDVALQLGNACVTGGAVAIVVFFLQSSEAEKAAQRDKALESERQFQTQLLMTANLAGFDPPPKERGVNTTGAPVCPAVIRTPLRGGYLASKTLDGARLDALDLRSTDFRGASLRGVTFRCAQLSHARLLSADLSQADLSGSQLANADLRGASLHEAEIADVADWTEAKVNTRTCWPDGFLTRHPAIRDQLSIRKMEVGASGELASTYGHVCQSAFVIFQDGVQRAVPSTLIPRAEGEP